MVCSEGVFMKKAVFISIDAMLALFVAVLLVASLSVLQRQDHNDLELYRAARDYYEVKRIDANAVLPQGVEQGAYCDSKQDVVIERAFEYDKSSNSLQEVIIKVCYS